MSLSQDLTRQMSAKTNESLLAMHAKPEDWTSEALDAARIELQTRGVEANTCPTPNPTTDRHRFVFGQISLLVLCAAAGLVVYFPLTVPADYTGERGLGYALSGLYYGSFLCIVDVPIALVGLIRREHPRWPATLGLALSILPALGGVYLLCGAAW